MISISQFLYNKYFIKNKFHFCRSIIVDSYLLKLKSIFRAPASDLAGSEYLLKEQICEK